jgi:hypothetical protein
MVIAEKGSAMMMGSTALQGYPRILTVPRSALERPKTTAYRDRKSVV